ncbi:two-component sensor histidine kinase [Paenibacillus segetis]|uniref:histidine kinase n=2 Tax=Paenibacillus segetis TaxID=1325360 RepID=A0ABQ1YGG7_9BACL|nr:two-component sensor histidine kinase [Paenibacillus segetis]
MDKVAASLRQTREGSRNVRIRSHSRDRSFQRLTSEINGLLDQFQLTEMEFHKSESARKKLITNISHDLRTPLTSVLGYLEVLRKDTSISEVEREQYTEIIWQKSNRLYELTESFFQLAKLDDDEVGLRRSEINLSAMIKEIWLSYIPQIEDAGTKGEVCFPDNDLIVSTDRISVERILGNLLSNSLKYGAAGGVIGLTLSQREDEVLIEIWDKGPGISEDHLLHIFDRLYTVDSSRNGPVKGSGLGLAIAMELATKQGGKLWGTSLPNVRTSFFFTLPKSSLKI